MHLGDVLSALRRRWYVVLLGLLLTTSLGYGAILITPPQFSARGLVLLLPPEKDVGEGGNPFLMLGGLDLPARVLIAYYQSASAQDEIARVAPEATASIMVDESTRGPIIAIDVINSSPEGALATLNYLADSIPETLASLQEEVGAGPDVQVTSLPLTMDTETELDLGDTTRMIIAALVVGLALTAFAAISIDGLVRRTSANPRSARTGRTSVDDDADENPVDTTEPGIDATADPAAATGPQVKHLDPSAEDVGASPDSIDEQTSELDEVDGDFDLIPVGSHAGGPQRESGVERHDAAVR